MKNRLISFLLVFLTVFGALLLPVTAEDSRTDYEIATDTAKNNNYNTVTEKLTAEITAGYTDLYAQNEKYQLFCNKYTGEVYLRDRLTGQYLTSNPTDVGKAQQEDKLSQIWLSFRTFEEGAPQVNYNSFNMAAKKGQISVNRTRGGIRVEYTMGDVASRYIAPQAILETDFQDTILKPLQEDIIDYLNYEFVTTRFNTFVDETAEVYSKLPVLSDDPDPYAELREEGGILSSQKAFADYLATEIGTPSANPAYRDRNVCSRFRYDYSKAKEKIEQDTQNGVPGAEEKREEMLNQVRLLIPTATFLPDAADIGEAFSLLYKNYRTLTNDYRLIVDLNNMEDEAEINNLKKKYACLDITLEEGETYPVIRTLDYSHVASSESSTIRLFQKVQKYFMESIPKYTMTVMLAQEEKVGFEALAFDNPLFRCALEYTLDDTGMTVDVPASSIIFDESKYEIVELSFLRYFGAGKTENTAENDGYIFYPDGSGALIYNKSMPAHAVMSQPVYSYDYSFSNLGMPEINPVRNNQPIRLPVFGAVNNVQTGKDGEGRPVYSRVGYLAVISEGESLARICAKKLDESGTYVGAYTSYTFRETDNYSIGRLVSGSTVSISADFKYTGFYTQKYIMLTDSTLNPDGYRADYVGMADAYRDYLLGSGALTAISEEELNARLPLFIESYATVKTVETVLSFPVTVNKPLTSFEDVRTIGDELREAGIGNVKFRLIGYYNDGFQGYYPNRVKWIKEIGGKKGFASLMQYVEEHKDEGFDAFTDVDLLYNYRVGKIGGISRKKTSARSMDDRYVLKIAYSTIYRDTTSNMGLLISASKLAGLFNKFHKKFSKFKSTSIALANLASDLSSNFNEDDFFTREEAKTMISNVLETASGKYTVMSTGGNVYAIPYIDYLLAAPVDDSHYNYVSRTVPFFGMVMHGSLQYAGDVFNEAGNPDYELLRDIESGAGMYVVLVYQNTDLMKENDNLIRHYSANYKIWHDDLISYYDVLDYAIGDLQTWKLSDHQFLAAERIAQESEKEGDAKTLEDEYYALLVDQYETELTKLNKFFRYLYYIGVSPDDTTKESRIASYAQIIADGSCGAGPQATILGVIDELEPGFDWAAAYKSFEHKDRAKELAADALKRLVDPTDPGYDPANAFSTATGQTVKVEIDAAAIKENAALSLNAPISSRLAGQIDEFASKNSQSNPTTDKLEYRLSGVNNYATSTKYSYVTDSEADDPAYKTTAYTINDGSVVLVTYSNGTQTVRFLLNFSIFAVNVKYDGELYTLGKYDFIRLDSRADGTTDPRTR